ncbi:MAG: hypothetical protein H6713_41970 [Myxococcales bacterium]|nr:hypothetical protein [Myxococcales bacterium]
MTGFVLLAHTMLAVLDLREDRPNDARSQLAQCDPKPVAGENPRYAGVYWALAARVARATGRVDDSLRFATEAERLLSSSPPLHVLGMAEVAFARKAAGDDEGALVMASAAVELLDTLGAVADAEFFARLSLVEVLFARGDVVHATAALVAAVEALERRLEDVAESELRRSFVFGVTENRRLVELALKTGVPLGPLAHEVAVAVRR